MDKETFNALIELEPYPEEALKLQDVNGFYEAVLLLRNKLNLRSLEEAYEEVESIHKHLYGSSKYRSYESCAESYRKYLKKYSQKKTQKNPTKLGIILCN